MYYGCTVVSPHALLFGRSVFVLARETTEPNVGGVCCYLVRAFFCVLFAALQAAARAYDREAVKRFGESAQQNFPVRRTTEAGDRRLSAVPVIMLCFVPPEGKLCPTVSGASTTVPAPSRLQLSPVLYSTVTLWSDHKSACTFVLKHVRHYCASTGIVPLVRSATTVDRKHVHLAYYCICMFACMIDCWFAVPTSLYIFVFSNPAISTRFPARAFLCAACDTCTVQGWRWDDAPEDDESEADELEDKVREQEATEAGTGVSRDVGMDDNENDSDNGEDEDTIASTVHDEGDGGDVGDNTEEEVCV